MSNEYVRSGNLSAFFDNDMLQTVFVGGKGGVGKTTCSSSIALQFSRRRSGKVLLISTDPAHNVSDAFSQQFNGTPKRVRGLPNLYAAEVDPAFSFDDEMMQIAGSSEKEGVKGDQRQQLDEFFGDFKQFIQNMPGIDEAMALSSVLDLVDSNEFSLLVFDTAPTGHTIRLLQLPGVLQMGLEKLQSWKARLNNMFNSFTSFLYKDEGRDQQQKIMKNIEEKMKFWLDNVTKISNMFRDTQRTQFVCVCNATFLSVYETKRLILELREGNIECKHVIVNMLMPRTLAFVKKDATLLNKLDQHLGEIDPFLAFCVRDSLELCGGTALIQQQYLQILKEELGQDISLVLLPLLAGEVRGTQNLATFSQKLVQIDERLQVSKREVTERSELTLKVMEKGDYVAETKAKFMNRRGSSHMDENKEKPEPTPAVNMENVTPDMIAVVQKVMMQPGGVQLLLNHKLVTEMKQGDDEEMKTFFTDLEANGIFAGLKYMSNKHVMSKLAFIANKINEETE